MKTAVEKTAVEVAMDFAEKFQANYPAKPLYQMMQELADGIKEYASQQQPSRERIIKLLEIAKCPNCEGSGVMGRTDNNGDVEWEQCQWCDERKKAIASELSERDKEQKPTDESYIVDAGDNGERFYPNKKKMHKCTCTNCGKAFMSSAKGFSICPSCYV